MLTGEKLSTPHDSYTKSGIKTKIYCVRNIESDNHFEHTVSILNNVEQICFETTTIRDISGPNFEQMHKFLQLEDNKNKHGNVEGQRPLWAPCQANFMPGKCNGDIEAWSNRQKSSPSGN